MINPSTCILIKEDAMDTMSLLEYYIEPLEKIGIPRRDIVVKPLLYNTSSKILAKTAKAYLAKLINIIPSSIDKLVIADANYFKFITKIGKINDIYGTTVQGAIENYEKFKCTYVPNYKSLFNTPNNTQYIELGIKVLKEDLGKDIIHNAYYATRFGQDRELLDTLYQYKTLTADIETNGLAIDSKLLSISFAWDQHNGIAIDLKETGTYYLKKFFESYSGNLIFHNGLFDIKLLVRNLWMNSKDDWEGMITGLSFFQNVDDSMLTTYIETNSTVKHSLSLKNNTVEYTGQYAIEVENLSKYTRKEILQYNLIDSLATWYLWNKYIDGKYSRPYKEIFRPSIYPLLKMMLVGLPMDSNRVKTVNNELNLQEQTVLHNIQTHPLILTFNKVLQREAVEEYNSTRKKKRKTIKDFEDVVFNPSSNQQLSKLLYEHAKLPILEKTNTGNPSTEAKVLNNLKQQINDQSIIDLLDMFLDLANITKINGTFIKAFMQEEDYLHGNLRLGGTQSGRLSSNSPNLTNLPSQGKMGKLIKSCIVAPDGWLFAGADFSALEERIGAILSKDPERIKIYTEGYDGHSVRAYKYFSEQMPDIDPNNVTSINSIADKYPDLRQKSKGPTFALQYSGTAYTLHKNAGIPMNEAEKIEKAFHDLYKVSDEFADSNREFMEANGYVECAFGLKLRTPIVRQCILGNSKTPKEADAEVRSANNAVTQSWGMLLNRAMIATNNKIDEAGLSTSILPINMIHDAGYFLVKDDPAIVKFLNDTLIKEMEWNDDCLIRSTEVPMQASLEIGKSWDTLTELKNNASFLDISSTLSTIRRSSKSD